MGIDQTGAVNNLGKPKPLPCCLIRGNHVEFYYLDSFSRKDIFKTLKLDEFQQIVVCLDCVLGLPQELNISWRQALDLIKSNEGYGREPARKFFLKLGEGQILRRTVEIICSANSVFSERPFQKNIQTGTYRMWKDIANSDHGFMQKYRAYM